MSELEPQIESTPGEGATPPAAEPAEAQPVAPSAKKRSRVSLFVFGALSGCLLVVGAAALIALAFFVSEGESEHVLSTSKVAIIPIDGVIMDSRDTIDLLHKYGDSAIVRAIVIRINSPGGAVAPSQEIYQAIREVRRESGKPVVASFDSVAASGGYYIAAACDRIVSNPGSITGSIGVILEWMEVSDLLTWAKIKPQTITAGQLKATGSPYKEMTEEERALLTGVVNQLHSQFVRAVAEGREGKLSLEEVHKVADGRIFTGEQALGYKLVDQLGNLDDAVRAAGKLAGLRGEPARIYPKPRRPGFFELLADPEGRDSIDRILSRRAPRFLYRW